MSGNKNSNWGCLFFGLLLIILIIGLLASLFHSDEKSIKKKNKLIKTYLTLQNKDSSDTLITFISPYLISKDYTLKKTVEQSLPFSDSLMTYNIDIPNGFVNSIVLAQMPKNKNLDLNGAVRGGMDMLKNNSKVENLTYVSKDTLVQNAKAKIVLGKFQAQNKNAHIEELIIEHNNRLYTFAFINEDGSTEWVNINRLIKSIKLTDKK